MIPATPKPSFDSDLKRPATSISSRMPHHFKWKPTQDKFVSDEDIDLFLFVTPYVVPLDLMNELLEENMARAL